ncbi:hypothetical protein [Burkholderia thailandensis]|uniref:hypothetical protein n=1 Tax=Burkholderia thailandensis TaxID=57975 RepID=UPI001EE24F19|nr:hypothetical protein [Burkholderia thailandensis]
MMNGSCLLMVMKSAFCGWLTGHLSFMLWIDIFTVNIYVKISFHVRRKGRGDSQATVRAMMVPDREAITEHAGNK